LLRPSQSGRAGFSARAYTKEKSHAEAYITHAKAAVVGLAAMTGSSDFTVLGLTDNVELNMQPRREVELLQERYEKHWNEAEDITPDILVVLTSSDWGVWMRLSGWERTL